MIDYKRRGRHHLLNLFVLRGSVFPRALVVAAPCGMLAELLRFIIDESESGIFWNLKDENSILSNNQVFGGFSFLMGFLIVFRTSEAYGRFWEGTTHIHRMRAEWFDAASACTAFCHYSLCPPKDVMVFKQVLIRLFSMLHSASLAELDIASHIKDAEEMRGFSYEVLDPASLDEVTLNAVRASPYKVELIFAWIQGLIVSEIRTGVLSIPPPILSRVFQELANGMVAFHEAQKIVNVPFPFPYAQICDCLLVLHWLLVPFVTTQWVQSHVWGFIFVFIQVFTLWSLNFIAVEIEDPFGDDLNDLDGETTQSEFNGNLELLVQEESNRIPSLRKKAITRFEKTNSFGVTEGRERSDCKRCSMSSAWTKKPTFDFSDRSETLRSVTSHGGQNSEVHDSPREADFAKTQTMDGTALRTDLQKLGMDVDSDPVLSDVHEAFQDMAVALSNVAKRRSIRIGQQPDSPTGTASPKSTRQDTQDLERTMSDAKSRIQATISGNPRALHDSSREALLTISNGLHLNMDGDSSSPRREKSAPRRGKSSPRLLGTPIQIGSTSV